MKINSIQAISNFAVKNNKNVNTEFKGLWGTPTFNTVRDDIHETHYTSFKYYPFKDESDEDIAKIRKERSWARHYLNENWRSHSDPQCIHERSIVDVREKLPFTTQEFNDYKNNNLAPLDRDIIKYYLREYSLVDLSK